MEHKTPCPSLEELFKSLKEAEQILLKHERELGSIGANVGLLVDGQKRLFFCIDDLNKIAARNETNIDNLTLYQEMLANEIKNGLKEDIAKTVVQHVTGSGMEQAFAKAVVQETAVAANPEIAKRFNEIDQIMWLPRMLDSTVKKWVVAGLSLMILIGIVLLIAWSSASMWGYFKETKWGETKGLIQSIVIDKNTHAHTAPDGSIYIHSHDNPETTPIHPKK